MLDEKTRKRIKARLHRYYGVATITQLAEITRFSRPTVAKFLQTNAGGRHLRDAMRKRRAEWREEQVKKARAELARLRKEEDRDER